MVITSFQTFKGGEEQWIGPFVDLLPVCMVRTSLEGNILFANWGGHGGSSGGAVLEVTRDKKLVSTTGDAVKNRVSSLFVKLP